MDIRGSVSHKLTAEQNAKLRRALLDGQIGFIWKSQAPTLNPCKDCGSPAAVVIRKNVPGYIVFCSNPACTSPLLDSNRHWPDPRTKWNGENPA